MALAWTKHSARYIEHVFYAHDARGVKIEPAPRRTGTCPTCGEVVLPKCGKVRVWHWAHLVTIDCDRWQEGESEWHQNWKRQVPPERAEVCMGEHRADMLSSDDCVVELQHSSLSAVQIQEREAFYGKMVWLLDGTVLQNRLRVESVGNQTEFTWAHERLSWRVARKPIFVHGFSLGRSMKYLNPRSGRLEASWQETIRSSDVLQIKSFAKGKHVRGEAKIIPLGHFCEKLFH